MGDDRGARSGMQQGRSSQTHNAIDEDQSESTPIFEVAILRSCIIQCHLNRIGRLPSMKKPPSGSNTAAYRSRPRLLGNLAAFYCCTDFPSSVLL